MGEINEMTTGEEIEAFGKEVRILKRKLATAKDSYQMVLDQWGERVNRNRELNVKLSKLTGHAPDCEIQVDPEWKPCTCGRG